MPTKTSHAQWSKIRESPRDWRVIRWLRKKPVPAYVIGVDDDGEEIRVELVGKVGERPHWADATRALHHCDKLTAHNAGGGILRVLEHDDENDPELLAENQREEAKRNGAELVGSSILAIDVPRLVKEIAESMERVANGAAEQQAKAHSEAFKQMGNVITIAMNLLVRLERELDAATARSATEEESSDPKDAFIQAALSKAFGGGGLPTNGGGALDLQAILANPKVHEFLAMLNSAQPTDDGGANGH